MSDENTIRDHIEMIADAITLILSESRDKSQWPLDRFKIQHRAGRGEILE